MRVMMLSSLFPPHVAGGAELYASELATKLEHQGHTVGVITVGVQSPKVTLALKPSPYRLDQWASQPLPSRCLFHLQDLYRPGAARAVENAVRQFAPDVVHSHVVTGMSSAVLRVPSRLGVGHVHTLHDYWLLCRRSSLSRRTGTLCRRRCPSCVAIGSIRQKVLSRHRPHVVVAPSLAIAKEHERRGLKGWPIRVIPHPVPAEVGPKSPKSQRPLRFGFIGALTRAKGIPTLLRAFASLPPAIDAELVVAGRGPLEPAVIRCTNGRVRFLGWVEGKSKEAFFDGIDCLVVPSEWREPAGLVINEAAARAIPVIASSIGGIPELVPDCCGPLLFHPGNARDLARAMTEFAEDPARFRAAPRRSPTWDEHLALILDAYREAIERARSAHA